MQEKEMAEKNTEQTHRQKIEAFNQYLGKLTEHFDIPRVYLSNPLQSISSTTFFQSFFLH